MQALKGAHDSVPRLLTVSNRGPVEFHRDDAGSVIPVPGSGGLSTALTTAAQIYPTAWLSSPLSPVDREIAAGETQAPQCNASHFVPTLQHAYDLFYGCFSNEVLWFLQHGLPWPDGLTGQRIAEAWHEGYYAVNQAFADAIVSELDGGGIRAVVLHDYHFYAAPRLVRLRRPDVFLQHFVHIPWPGPREWQRLDASILASICEGLLANDSLVFQTDESARDFLLTCEAALAGCRIDLASGSVEYDGHTTRVWANGISVDPEELDAAARTPEFSRYRYLLRPAPGQKTIVRVDRLDPTKNVLAGFEAYARLLDDHPELRERVQFLALLVPTKGDIETYRRYQDEAQTLAGEVNRRFGSARWKPVRIFFEHNRTQALAAMSLYDVLLVNSVADGMNLVAKEGPLLNTHDGVLVLSRRAGAYGELGCASLGIDPLDVAATASALYEGLTMAPPERRERAQLLRQTIRRRDLRDWFRVLLSDIEGRTAVLTASSDTTAA